MTQTKGEYLVGVSFNPSKNPQVDQIKAKTAELIDLMEGWAEGVTGVGAREASCAITNYEQAAMWAVKAVTKEPRQ
jgi:hypothetical protein